MKKSVRDTSLEAFKKIVESGLLGRRQREVYEALFEHEPCTANELFKKMEIGKGAQSNQNVVTRLGELREAGCVDELPKRTCAISGFRAHEWRTNGNMPVKFDKPKKIKCRTCKGKGFLSEHQARLF